MCLLFMAWAPGTDRGQQGPSVATGSHFPLQDPLPTDVGVPPVQLCPRPCGVLSRGLRGGFQGCPLAAVWRPPPVPCPDRRAYGEVVASGADRGQLLEELGFEGPGQGLRELCCCSETCGCAGAHGPRG